MTDDSVFGKRLKAAETGLAYEAEKGFRIMVSRNRKLGAWVADLMGFEGDKARDYVEHFLSASMRLANDEALLDKIIGDFDASKVECTERSVRRQMEDFFNEARNEIEKN